MRKSEKRRIGRDRQEQNLRDSTNAGLKAQHDDNERRDRQRQIIAEKAKASEQMAAAADGINKIKKSFEGLSEAAKNAGNSLRQLAEAHDHEIDLTRRQASK